MMKKQTSPSRIAAIVTAFVLVCSLWATTAMAAGPGTVTMTVTVAGKKDTSPPVVSKDDVELFLNKERSQVNHWQHAEKLFLAVLIDDSLRSDIANQWSDLKAFMANQPDTTYILVGYIRNGSVAVAQDFTNDHELAAKALRIPIGGGGAFSSPYLALQDLMKRMPESTATDRRSILLISSGIDYFRGEFELVDPDLDSTINRAQKDNINIWSIYAPDSGHRGRGFFVATRAQSNLSQLSGQTGGEAFFLSIGEPVTLKPYFDELATHLSNQYLLTFNANGGAKGRFERVRVTTELPYAEFMHASQAFLPTEK
jgi:VWFA-related protein